MARGKSTAATASTTDAAITQPPPTSMATVFVETTLDTRFAMLISPDDTIALLKRKFAAEHALSFPYIGEVNVQAIKVKRRSFFYHLSDAMSIRNAFDGIRRTWFLYVDAEASLPYKQISRAANISADEKGKKFSLVDPSLPDTENNKTTSFLNSHHGHLLSGETITNNKAENTISQENGPHNVFERNLSEVNRLDPPSYEMKTQTSKNNDAAEVQDKSKFHAEGMTGDASIVAVKKEKSKKRGIDCQDTSTMEELPEQSFARNKKHKAKDGSATSGSLAVEIANHKTKETTEDGPHEEVMGLSESKRSSQTICVSSLPSSPMSDKKKTKKKKQSYNLLGDIESPDAGKLSFASAGNHEAMGTPKPTEFIGDRAVHAIPAEPVQNPNVRMREMSHAGNDGDVGSDKIDKHPDYACDMQDLVICKTTVVEDAVPDSNFEKADVNNLVVDASKKHRRKKKILGKSALEDHLLEHEQIIGDPAMKEIQQIRRVEDHTNLNNVSDGAAIPGETTTLGRFADADYAISLKPKDGQSRRRKEKATKSKVVSEEEHHKESNLLETNEKHTDLQPPSVVDTVSPHNIPDGSIGYLIEHLPTDGENNEGELSKKADVPAESLSFENTLLVDSAVPTRPIDKKPRRGRKKSAKSGLLNSHDNEAESLHSNEENTRMPMGNHNFDRQKVSEQDPGPSKVGVSTSNPTAYAMQVNSSGKDAVLDNHKNSSKMSIGSVAAGEAQALPKPIAMSSIQPIDQKSRRSKKLPAQLKLLNDESMQSEVDHPVGKELIQNSKGGSEKAENANLGKESQSANTRRGESALQGPITERLTESLGITQADSQAAREKLEHNTDNRKRKQSKKSKKSSVSEEALNYVNPRPEKATKQLQEGSQKPTESILPLGKEACEENGEITHENNETGIAAAIDAAIASFDCPTANNLYLDMNDVELPPGSENITRNPDEAGAFPGSLHSGTIQGVDNTGQEDTEPVVQGALTDRAGDKVMQNSKSDIDNVKFIDFFAPKANFKDTVSGKEFAPLDADCKKQNSGKTKKKRRKSRRQEEEYHKTSLGEKHSTDVMNYGLCDPMEHPNSKGRGFTCMETDIEEENNQKARRKRKSDVHAKNSSQEHNNLLKKPSDSDPVSPGLNNYLELCADEEYRSDKYAQATVAGTTNFKGQDGVTNNCDRDTLRKSPKSCYSVLDDDSAVHKKSESSENQSKVMHKAEAKPLLPENNQNYHSSGRRVTPKKGFVDEHIESNESTEQETPMQKDRYRLAVRKVPHRRIAEVLESSKQKKIMTASSGTIFDDLACGISDEELVLNSRKKAAENAPDNSFASDNSDSESDETSITSLKNQSSTKTPQHHGFWSNARGNESKEVHSGECPLTQSNTGKRSLGAILKGTSSYKKAKLSQSQNEDAESQPDDFVLETQPDYFSS